MDDLAVVGGIGDVRQGVDHGREVGRAPDPFELALLAEVVGHREQIHRLAAFVEREARGVDEAVGLDVELLIADLFDDHEQRIGVEEDGAEHSAFGLGFVG